MAPLRHRAALALPLSVLLALSGCSSDDDPEAGSPSASTSPTASATSSASPSTSASASARPSAAASTSPAPEPVVCEAVAGLREGTWEGPVSWRITSDGGGADFTDTGGAGSLRVVVADGKVVTGSWSARWRSVGRARTEQAEAEVTLNGTIGGRITGTARQPVLTGTWRVQGKAVVIRPRKSTVPIDESGSRTAPLSPRSTGCDDVVGAFSASFVSKEAQVTFTGKGTWKGRRVG